MKKTLLSLVLSLVCMAGWAQEIATISGIKYYLENGEATVMQQDVTLSGAITIPEKVTSNGVTYTVTSLENNAFYKCESIQSVVLPNSVTLLGEYCFYDCCSLTSIDLPDGLTSLGNGCFEKCI